jgi:hypothetical protein
VAHSTVALCILLGVISMVLPPLIVLILAAPIYSCPGGGAATCGILPTAWWSDFWAWFGATVSAAALAVLVPMLFQIFCNRFIFFRRSWILYRPLYALYDYNMIFANALIGFVQTLARINMLFFMFVLFFARLDKTLMPGPGGTLWAYDGGFKAYIAMLRMDHRYNNPVMMVFTELMIAHLRLFRVQRAQRRHRRPALAAARSSAELIAADGGGDGGGGESAVSAQQRRRQAVLARWQTAALAALDAKRLRARRARTRWRLTKLLFFNPTLRQYRKQALRDAAALLRQRITSVAERSIRSVKSGKGDRVDAAATTAGLLAVGSFLNAEV